MCRSYKAIQTPLIRSDILSHIFDNNIFLKMESNQISGSFKFRGALNGVLNILPQLDHCVQESNFFNETFNNINKSFTDESENSKNEIKFKAKYSHISTYTTGNYGIALCHLSKIFGFKLKIFAPKYILENKINTIKKYQEVELNLTQTREEAETAARTSENGYFLHPSGDQNVIDGIASIISEIIDQLPDEVYGLLAPCGGGGLLSGLYQGLIWHDLSKQVKIFGCEPLIANDGYLSLLNNKIFRFNQSPQTVADALRALSLSELTFNYIKNIEKFFLSTEEEIFISHKIMQSILKEDFQLKQSLTDLNPIEISSSIVFSGLCKWKLDNPSVINKNIVLIISGGNC